MTKRQKIEHNQYPDGIPYFPVFINLDYKRIVVFGAGNVALRRIRTLQFFHAAVSVITKEIPDALKEEFRSLTEEAEITVRLKEFHPSDLEESIDIVLAATDNAEVNESIWRICKEKGILVNNASDASLCDFYFPAVALTEDIVIGVTGNGRNHKKVAAVTEEIRRYLEIQQDEND